MGTPPLEPDDRPHGLAIFLSFLKSSSILWPSSSFRRLIDPAFNSMAY